MESDLSKGTYEFRACGPINTKLKTNLYVLNKNILDEYMTEYEIDVLLLLAAEAYSKNSKIAELSFQGIKTKLNIHQQKLAVALKRLINKNLVEKTLNGYTLKRKGLILIDKILSSNACFNDNCEEYFGLEISIPINNKNNNLYKLIYLLKGRWFSHWRWIGMFSESNSIKMEWQSLDDDLETCLCINENQLCIAIFDKSPNSSHVNPNIKLLEGQFNEFLNKIQNIMNLEIFNQYSSSKFVIKTYSSCDKIKMKNWISNYT
ncbi:MAG: hypothetical protein ACTSPY_01780 [Candidatus Helarchaeota archaeon]